MYRLVRITAVLGFLTAAAVTDAQSQGRIGGTVLDARFRPVEGASVTLVGGTQSARTNNAGVFRLDGLTGETVSLRVQRLGYEPLTLQARVGDNNVRASLADLAVNLNALVVTGTAGGVEKRVVGNAVAQVK